MRTPDPGRWGALGLAVGLCWCTPSAAQAKWSWDLAMERARVTLGQRDVTWATNRLQLNAGTAPGEGWYLAAEGQKRERDTDTALIGGAFGQSGAWLWAAQASVAANPGFMPRYSLEPQVGHRIGPFVLTGGAVYRSFEDSRVRIGTLSLTGYRGDSELELKLAYGDSQPFDRHVRVATLRGLWDPGGKWSAGASVSAGRGLWDSINVPGVRGNTGRAVNANLRYRLPEGYSVRLDLTSGRENPSFKERRLGLSLRKIF